MTKQEEIREDAIIITKNQLWAEGIRDEQRLAVRAIQIVDQIFHRQSDKGVVIKVDRELPKNPFDAEVARYSNRPVDEEATLDEHVVVCSSNGFEKGMSTMLKAGYILTKPLREE